MAQAAVVGMADQVEVGMELVLTKSEQTPVPEEIIQVESDEMSLVFNPLKDELSQAVRAACRLMPPADITVSPPGSVLPENFCNYAKKIRDLEVYDDDIWVISFPKCGSRLTQEMIWLLTNHQDYEEAQKTPLYKRFVFLEYVALWPEGADQPDTVSWVEHMPAPRLIKSHLPLELLPTQLWTKKPKIIYIGRNPKDTALDYFTHYQRFYQYSGSQEQFLEAFYHDRVVFSPFWEHVLSFWSKRKEPNVLISTFEEMSQNLQSVLERTADFLKVKLEPEEEIKLLYYLRNNKVKAETSDSSQGEELEGSDNKNKLSLVEAGSWRRSMTPTYVERFDKWTKEKLAGTDFSNVFMII